MNRAMASIAYEFCGLKQGFFKILRRYFDIGAHIIDDKGHVSDYESIRIKTESEDNSEIIKKIKKAYRELGGNLHDENS